MKPIIFTSLLILSLNSTNLLSQNKDVWSAFEDESTGLYGFKDDEGNVKVEAKFLGFMLAPKFSDIVALMEDNNTSYYLTKKRNKVGRDSLYIFDNSYDCESEGFIRFRDKKNNTTGMFNSEGKVVVPAEYNYLSEVRNGLIVAIKGAQKEFLNNDSTDEHWGWSNGTKYLIDTANNIIVKDFEDNGEIDFHSLIIVNTLSSDKNRDNYPGIDGRYYTFINNMKLFESWLKNNFLKDVSEESLLENCYPNIIYWSEDSGWVAKSNKLFMDDYFGLIKERLSRLNKDSADYFISIDDFVITPPDIGSEFEKYLDNCGHLKTSQFPLMNVVINFTNGNDFYQDNFDFFKSENGFQLLTVVLRDALMK